jgi:hypothetical protein
MSIGDPLSIRAQQAPEQPGFAPVARTPLTREQIEDLLIRGGLYDCLTDPYDKHGTGDPWGSVMDDLEKVVRKVEAAHGVS